MAQCPKCGESSADGTVICPGCDFILDAAFLGDDILNERTGQQKPVSISSGGDAVVFGGLDEPIDMMFSESTGSFLTADTLDVDRQIVRAPVYVGKSVQELMKPEAVLAQAKDIEKRKAMLSAFELHVLSFVDGVRPVARLRKKTGLSGDDLRIAVGMLAEKNAVVLAGVIAPPAMKDLLAGELDNSDDDLPATHDGPLADVTHDQQNQNAHGDDEWHEATTEDVPPGAPPPPREKDTGEVAKARFDSMDIPDVAEVEDHAKGPSPWGGNSNAAPLPPSAASKSPKQPAPPIGRKPGIASPAVDAATAAAHDRRSKAKSFFDLAHSELGKGNRVRAHVYAKLAAETDPSEPKYQELLKTWAVSSRSATTLEASLFADADQAEKQGNHHKALALMQQALDASPSAAHVHNRMGLLLAMRFKKFSQASEHLMRACELEPNNVVYKNNLGKIIAVADERGARQGAPRAKSEKGMLNKLKKALE
jgi:hypothetical protein